MSYSMLINRKRYFKFICFFFLNMNWIIDVIHLPEAVKNSMHVFALLFMLWTAIVLRKKSKSRKDNKWLWKWIAIYSVGVLIGWLINGLSPVLVLWSFTKTYILFFFFVSCVVTLEVADLEYFFDLLCKYQVINALLVLFQFFVLHISGDWLGGIFGIRQGANAYTNVYFVIICAYTIIRYLCNQKKLRHMIWILSSSCVIAGLTELTAFFVELVMILFVAIILSKNVRKKIVVGAIGVTTALIGFVALAVVFPTRFNYIYDLKSAMTYLGGQDNSYYTAEGLYVGGAYSVSRLNPFEQINRYFFHDDILKLVFGYGLGNCEMSPNIPLLQSKFYLQNKDYEYYVFSHAATFIETGIWGLVSYATMLFCLVKTWYKYRKENNKYSYLLELGVVMVIMTVVLFFYNSSVRTPSAYILFISLCSIPVYVNSNNALIRRRGKVIRR